MRTVLPRRRGRHHHGPGRIPAGAIIARHHADPPTIPLPMITTPLPVQTPVVVRTGADQAWQSPQVWAHQYGRGIQ